MRGEVSDLEHLVQKALMAWDSCKKLSSEQGVYMDSVALNLHGLYSGLERLFELIARQVDQNMPCGDLWHRELLKQISLERQDIRPAVIGSESLYFLDELRRFRHLVRNVYTFNLMPEKIDPLISVLPAIWPKVKAEILAFADFLEQAGQTER